MCEVFKFTAYCILLIFILSQKSFQNIIFKKKLKFCLVFVLNKYFQVFFVKLKNYLYSAKLLKFKNDYFYSYCCAWILLFNREMYRKNVVRGYRICDAFRASLFLIKQKFIKRNISSFIIYLY